ncbi:Uncharacterised protein [Leclercia adecarboxylata]|uniref:Uncharacterized protein n=1 Tax=Leclercia adecarboxylata TaxID=83655 RepID=A0A4U9IT79_9ENTR|nr:Uncharacterised protein [Leclercia adecarboxylata]
MSLLTPSIDPRLAGIAPGFRALSIVVEAAPVTAPDVASAALAQACQQMLNDDFPGRRPISLPGMRHSKPLVRNRNALPAPPAPCASGS